jgi:hypothetical protein
MNLILQGTNSIFEELNMKKIQPWTDFPFHNLVFVILFEFLPEKSLKI